jgi:alanyl-tRNA synthetase
MTQTIWTSAKIRQQFLDFFKSKNHKIVPSAPLVNKDDPTLMFTNAGMNQFKDFFLGTAVPDQPRIADTQKCLRVSGKHNDLEEVGKDSYHHTMFEMLGNWSIGDYFKEEAIAWAWELLTEVYGLNKERIFVSVFEGDSKENLEKDTEAAEIWKKYVPDDRILYFNKKDNFWEMGDVGPCGPCSEIHYDLRTEEDRKKIPGKNLVNADHPQVVEIWNLVFIQFNRKADGSLEELPAKHVDTGMGFERLCMALQGKLSNYSTDVFSGIIDYISVQSKIKYTNSYDYNAWSDIAMRVVADHLRAVSFAIADGQLPSNTGAGYVIRRILRRAVRYYYSFLNIEEPFLHTLVPLLATQFEHVFPELKAQLNQVASIILGEEKSFLHTLENGLRKFEEIIPINGVIEGQQIFELYDTFGFPPDLTKLLATEKGLQIDEPGFETALNQQKERSRSDAKKSVGDWTIYQQGNTPEFVGYDSLQVIDAIILRTRTVKNKEGLQYQLVLNKTPFYAQSGGQAGDTGTIQSGNQNLNVLDTFKENDLTIHVVDTLPDHPALKVTATVDSKRRKTIEAHHSSAHLLHAALHEILGSHALQKGQDVDHKRIRFDFSHFKKVDQNELSAIEKLVNDKIRENIPMKENRNLSLEEAKKMGVTMLFGEKYGETVRLVTFDDHFSKELCGGTHVKSTAEIGHFKIISESAVAAGIRRIEAIGQQPADEFLAKSFEELTQLKNLLKSNDLYKSVTDLLDESKSLKKVIESYQNQQVEWMKKELVTHFQTFNDIHYLVKEVEIQDVAGLKNLCFQLEKETPNAIIVLGSIIQSKPILMVAIDKQINAKYEHLHAGKIISNLAVFISGGGGGQPFFASAGGQNPNGLKNALTKAIELIVN